MHLLRRGKLLLEQLGGRRVRGCCWTGEGRLGTHHRLGLRRVVCGKLTLEPPQLPSLRLGEQTGREPSTQLDHTRLEGLKLRGGLGDRGAPRRVISLEAEQGGIGEDSVPLAQLAWGPIPYELSRPPHADELMLGGAKLRGGLLQLRLRACLALFQPSARLLLGNLERSRALLGNLEQSRALLGNLELHAQRLRSLLPDTARRFIPSLSLTLAGLELSLERLQLRLQLRLSLRVPLGRLVLLLLEGLELRLERGRASLRRGALPLPLLCMPRRLPPPLFQLPLQRRGMLGRLLCRPFPRLCHCPLCPLQVCGQLARSLLLAGECESSLVAHLAHRLECRLHLDHLGDSSVRFLCPDFGRGVFGGCDGLRLQLSTA